MLGKSWQGVPRASPTGCRKGVARRGYLQAPRLVPFHRGIQAASPFRSAQRLVEAPRLLKTRRAALGGGVGQSCEYHNLPEI